jgi:hypothetical protein
MLHIDSMAKGYFLRHSSETASQGAVHPDTDQAFKLLSAGAVAVESIGEAGSIVEGFLPKAHEMTFAGLWQLITHSSQHPKPK